MKPNALLRTLLVTVAFAAAACLQATGSGEGTTGGSGGSGSAATGGSSGAGTTGGTGSGGSTTGGSSGGSSGGSTGGLGVGSPCTVSFGGGGLKDPCAAYGLACQVQGLSGNGTCQLPATGQACLPDAGCASGNVCTPGGPRGDVCAQTCAATTDCSSITTACDPDGGICATNGCTDFGGTCNAQGVSDGYCVAVPTRSGGTTGICMQAGDAGTNAPCSTTRSGTASYCQGGNVCVANPLSGAAACYGLCDPGSTDGGLACASGATCVDPSQIPGLGGKGGGGTSSICVIGCADGGASVCPEGQSCFKIPFGQSVQGLTALCVP